MCIRDRFTLWQVVGGLVWTVGLILGGLGWVVNARVVRNLEEGFALEFIHEQLAETLEDSVTAR